MGIDSSFWKKLYPPAGNKNVSTSHHYVTKSAHIPSPNSRNNPMMQYLYFLLPRDFVIAARPLRDQFALGHCHEVQLFCITCDSYTVFLMALVCYAKIQTHYGTQFSVCIKYQLLKSISQIYIILTKVNYFINIAKSTQYTCEQGKCFHTG